MDMLAKGRVIILEKEVYNFFFLNGRKGFHILAGTGGLPWGHDEAKLGVHSRIEEVRITSILRPR